MRNRQTIRLPEYDYSLPGTYFVTICVQNRECFFGEIIDKNMIANKAGKMVQTIWNEIPEYYPGINIDVFQIMPNHLHGIIRVVGANPCVCPKNNGQTRGSVNGQTRGSAPTGGLPMIVQRFKSLTTKQYIDGVKYDNWPPFSTKLWQRNYYEHIIRNENELNNIRQYIRDNPMKWQDDNYYV